MMNLSDDIPGNCKRSVEISDVCLLLRNGTEMGLGG
jgi:hypothetical protein